MNSQSRDSLTANRVSDSRCLSIESKMWVVTAEIGRFVRSPVQIRSLPTDFRQQRLFSSSALDRKRLLVWGKRFLGRHLMVEDCQCRFRRVASGLDAPGDALPQHRGVRREVEDHEWNPELVGQAVEQVACPALEKRAVSDGDVPGP